jgi:hypothetical protein
MSFSRFLVSNNSIKIKVSARLLKSAKDRKDLVTLFKDAIHYYTKSINIIANKMLMGLLRSGPVMKQMLVSTPLSGLVTYSLSILLIFDDLSLSKNPFRTDDDIVNTIKKFINDVCAQYSNGTPDKQTRENQRKMVEDLREMVGKLRKSATYTETVADIMLLPDYVDKWYKKADMKPIEESSFNFIKENVEDGVLFTEAGGRYKKLKKLSMDIIAYVVIEGETVKNANDKMMIVSYAYGKLDIVEWYIELLVVGSNRYLVPHTKEYLENFRTQLLKAIKTIMDRPLPKPDRPLIDIQYPKGYEG